MSEVPVEITRCVEAALDKKAEDLVVLDLRGLSDVTDYFIICHGNSDRQVLAIADGIETLLRQTLGRKPSHVEGRKTADWILMDYVDFVVHVFLEDRRSFYRLERLWGDAPQVAGSGRGALADSPQPARAPRRMVPGSGGYGAKAKKVT